MTSYSGIKFGLVISLLGWTAWMKPAQAQDPSDASPAMVKPIAPTMFGKISFTESNRGQTKNLGEHHIIWAADMQGGDWAGIEFGKSKVPGKRYLCVGFQYDVSMGSILAAGGGSLSVLKPGLTTPGNIADDSQWVPAQRIQNGAATNAEVGGDDVVLWTLPPNTTTRALRFCHTAQPIDSNFAGWLGGISPLADRFANLAPQAQVSAHSTPEQAGRINDETRNGMWGAWANVLVGPPTRAQTISADPEWITFTWPRPVTLQGLAGIEVGFAQADIQTYSRPTNQPPDSANDADWKTVQTVQGLKCHYPLGLDLNWMPFDAPVITRALRVRITGALDETGFHPHMVGKTDQGTRVWLGELFALEPLDNASLATAILPTPKQTEVHAPIPITFSLPEDADVTLVIDDSNGVRVRNLVSDLPLRKGTSTVYWDGTNDVGRDPDAANHGLYSIPVQFVAAGTYTVRGLWHKPIDLRYQMTFYTAGDPPWPTADTTGGWMTNHTPATATAFVPGTKGPGGAPVILLGAYISEGGSALSWLDLDGKKLGGRGWIGGAWTGAQYLATDTGSNAATDVAAYVGSAWRVQKDDKDEGSLEIRLTELGSKFNQEADKPVLTPVFREQFPPLPPRPDGKANDRDIKLGLGGLAVHDQLLVFSMPMLNQLVFVDSIHGRVLGKSPLASPRGLAFDDQGHLLVLTEKSLLRYTLQQTPNELTNPQTLASDLEDPWGITVDPSGKIYVSDQGNSNQVKVYSDKGDKLAVYGQGGPVKAGWYNPLHMTHPKGIAVDGNRRLWVTEDDYQPKRVSVWNKDGTLWKAFYGPPQYGGGGIIDPRDGSKIIYDGMEFHADIAKGEWDLKDVFFRPEDWFKMPDGGGGPPEMPVYFHGHRYLSNTFNVNAVSGTNIGFLFLDMGEYTVPVAAMGRADGWDLLKTNAFKSAWPGGQIQDKPTLFTWSDLNGDGQVQPEEVKMWPQETQCVSVAEDGSFILSSVGPRGGPFKAMRYKPVSFTDHDVPVYDANAGEVLAPAQESASDGGGQVLVGTNGWTIQTTAPPPFSNLGLGGSKNGVPAWSYPSLWPGLHPSHSSPPPDRPGELLGTTRLMGNLVTPKRSDAGPLFVINGNQGDMYCFTQDGLFVTQFFQDVRTGHLWEMPVAQRGMLLNDLTLHDENFFPAVSQTPEGQIYLLTGAIPAVVQPDGIGSIRRFDSMTLNVTASMLHSAEKFVFVREAARQATAGGNVMSVSVGGPAPQVDGHLDDWGKSDWVPIDHRGVAAYFDSHSEPYNVTGAVQIADGKLFAAWKTTEPDLLRNSGAAPQALFKTGGALDLMIGANPSADPNRPKAVPGDMRLLITQVKGTTHALLYRPVVPGTDPQAAIPFSAPWHSISIDRVDDVSDLVQLATDSAGNFEVSIPLETLGLVPRQGMKIKGDIGLLRGDGTQTTQRVYWNNKATAIVSDVPSEAELTPNLWGVWEFTSPK